MQIYFKGQLLAKMDCYDPNIIKDYSIGISSTVLKYFFTCTTCMYKHTYTLGWVNFSEFEITVSGSCKMSKKTKMTFLFF